VNSVDLEACERRRFLARLLAVPAAAVAVPTWAQGLSASSRVVISYNEDYAPFSWSEAGGEAQGILPDLLAALLREAGVAEVRSASYPWRRAQAVLQTTEADAICTFASDERKAYAHFNRVPVTVLRPALFYSEHNPRRAEIERIADREGLKGLVLADLYGNQWAEQNLAFHPRVEWSGSHDSVFRMVIEGRADAHVSLSPIVTRWRLKKLGIRDGVVSRPAPFVAADVPFHLGIRKTFAGAQSVLDRLDRLLAQPGYAKRLEAVVARYL
jgi:polar amino acid transport system substrate-binding protein